VEAVSLLSEMFPSVSHSELARSLSLADGQLDAAVQYLLECMDLDDHCSSPVESSVSVSFIILSLLFVKLVT